MRVGAKGAVTLGDVAGRLAMLEVRCDRCGRRGRLRVARLVAEHGPGMGLPELRWILVGDCPRREASAYERCRPSFPQLLELDRDQRGEG